MNQFEILTISFALAIIIVLARVLGVFKGSFTEQLGEGIAADYVRSGLITWKLVLRHSWRTVGIPQGKYLLPFAKARAKKVANGEASVSP